MSAIDAILTIGESVTVRVPMRRPVVLAECVARRAVEVADYLRPIVVQPGWPMQLVAFLDHSDYTLCLHRADVILIETKELSPVRAEIRK